MAITVRPLRADEGRTYLEIVNSAIHDLAAPHYSPELVDAWARPITEQAIQFLMLNLDDEIRLIAEMDGVPAGIGALVVDSAELRACYVAPAAARRGCGAAIVREIERLACEKGLTRLELIASINAEPFYASQGYEAIERTEHVIRQGLRMPAVRMTKTLV